MSLKSAKEFMEYIQRDDELQKKVKASALAVGERELSDEKAASAVGGVRQTIRQGHMWEYNLK